MKTAVYPGSFDPITNGHLNIIQRASRMVDRLIVAVVKNQSKDPLFTAKERMELIRKSVREIPNVEVAHFDGLLVRFVADRKADVIIKGLRSNADFEYELLMASVNHSLQPDVETLFLMANPKYAYLSSAVVREVAGLGGDIRDFVPDVVRNDILNKFRE